MYSSVHFSFFTIMIISQGMVHYMIYYVETYKKGPSHTLLSCCFHVCVCVCGCVDLRLCVCLSPVVWTGGCLADSNHHASLMIPGTQEIAPTPAAVGPQYTMCHLPLAWITQALHQSNHMLPACLQCESMRVTRKECV